MTRLDAALQCGAAFLIANQDGDGAWCDFDLAPGPATAWTTAYIAPCLQRLAKWAPSAPEPEPVEKAAHFLRRNRKPGGGWAYNWRCRADADSTALALLFLHGRTPAPHLKDTAVLAGFQTPQGGFATYAGGGDAWRVAHAEVTATALRALELTLPPEHSLLQTTQAWLAAQLARPGGADYWWTTGAYLALELARLGMGHPDPPAADAGAFDQALRLERAVILGQDQSAQCAALIAAQNPDGSWPASPILRVPDRAAAPGSVTARSGPAYADDRRLFTTATVLSALAAVSDLSQVKDADETSASCPLEQTTQKRLRFGADNLL